MRPVLFVFLLLAISAPVRPEAARADCLRDCWNEKHCDATNQRDCDWHRSYCVSRCTGQRSTSFGAIAYGGKSHAYGYSFDHDNAASAERMAMTNCRKKGEDCKVVASFSNACAAVASGAKDRFGAVKGASRKEAEAAALAACGKSAGGKCEIEVWTCALAGQ